MTPDYKNLVFVELQDQFAIMQEGMQMPGFIDTGGIPTKYRHLVEAAPMMYTHHDMTAGSVSQIIDQLELLAVNVEQGELQNLLRNIATYLCLLRGNAMASLRVAEVGKKRAMKELNSL